MELISNFYKSIIDLLIMLNNNFPVHISCKIKWNNSINNFDTLKKNLVDDLNTDTHSIKKKIDSLSSYLN